MFNKIRNALSFDAETLGRRAATSINQVESSFASATAAARQARDSYREARKNHTTDDFPPVEE